MVGQGGGRHRKRGDVKRVIVKHERITADRLSVLEGNNGGTRSGARALLVAAHSDRVAINVEGRNHDGMPWIAEPFFIFATSNELARRHADFDRIKRLGATRTRTPATAVTRGLRPIAFDAGVAPDEPTRGPACVTRHRFTELTGRVFEVWCAAFPVRPPTCFAAAGLLTTTGGGSGLD